MRYRVASPFKKKKSQFYWVRILYLVTEELLVEAHEKACETPVATSMFFIGFLAIIVVDELMR